METAFDTKNLTLKALTEALKGKTINELHEFADKHFGKRIGQGAYRSVWRVELRRNRVVALKISNHENSTWSNRKELKVWNKFRKSITIIAKIFAHDTAKGRWIVSEFVPNPITDDDVMAYFQISKEDWKRLIGHFHGDSMVYYFENRKNQENRWYKELLELKQKGKVYDLHWANWRMNVSRKPILVDYGCSDLK